MSLRRSFERDPGALRSSKLGAPSLGTTFLIVTEGKRTEPNYFLALRGRLNLGGAVDIRHPEGTDPLTLTRAAIQMRNDREQQARGGLAVAYDEVWVVFDMEKPHDKRRKLAAEAMSLGQAAGIQLAWSDPCFEFWLLLHESFTTAHFADCNRVIERLKPHWKSYSKGQSPTTEFLEKIPIAIMNAERCRQHHASSRGDWNPSTRVDILVRQLNSARRSHLQFKLRS